jgi:5-methylcytosine-specific restriction endonuclease McrA
MEPTHRTLVLSQGFEPLSVVSWKQAITMFFLGKCEVLEEYDQNIKTTGFAIKIPAVVRLINAIRRHKKPVKFSRINIYGRDKYTCQYCGKKHSINDLTYDHVVPRSKGGKTTWANIATCCEPCNRRKSNRTPKEAGMNLLKEPEQPTATPVLVVTVSRESVPDAWRDYLYWTGALEQD